MAAPAATLLYWPILARNVYAELVAAAGGVALARVEPEWPGTLKSATPFGQLPVMDIVVDGATVRVAQSFAIMRVLARRGGIAGNSEADFARSEMLIEEAADIYTALAKPMYAPGYPATRPEAYAAFFAPGGPASAHVGFLEALVTPEGDFTAERTAGEAAVMGSLYLLAQLEPAEALFAAAPKLQAFYSRRLPAAAALLHGLRPYFSRAAVKGPEED